MSQPSCREIVRHTVCGAPASFGLDFGPTPAQLSYYCRRHVAGALARMTEIAGNDYKGSRRARQGLVSVWRADEQLHVDDDQADA